jgi:hypothetical protein
LATSVSSKRSQQIQIPTSFIDFCKLLEIKLTPAQRVLALVCFDGVEPRDLEGEERELARELFGASEEFGRMHRAIVAILAGRRAGKSYVCAIRVLHLALIHSLARLAKGEIGFGVIIAPTLSQARQVLRFCSGAANANSEIAAMIRHDTAEQLVLLRPDGKTAGIVCKAASSGGLGARSGTLFAAVMDEACFFRDGNYAVNDEEIYLALRPALLPGAQVMMPSTPWTEGGLLYNLWKANFGTPVNAIAVHAKTTTLQPDETTAEMVASERARDAQNAMLEYDAVPMEAGTAQFFEAAAIKLSIIEDMALVLPMQQFARTFCGLDTGFRKDPSAACVVRLHADGYHIDLVEVLEIIVPKGERLKPSETIAQLLERAKQHKCEQVLADQHYIESVREQGGTWSLTEAPRDPAVPYVATRTMMREGRLRMSAGHERLLAQLKDVVARPTAGGNLSISSPRKGGAHGDIVSALVLAVWAASSQVGSVPTFAPAAETLTSGLTRNLPDRRLRYG